MDAGIKPESGPGPGFSGGSLAKGEPHPKQDTPLLKLLGPLVSPLLRDPSGGLDLTKFPRGSFEEFKDFLITQVKVDGIAFNQKAFDKVFVFDSYQEILEKEEYEPLLEDLYQEATVGSRDPGLRSARNDNLLKKFTAEIVEVSPEKFVSAHIQSEAGRKRIRSVLSDRDHYSPDLRSDLAKAIAQTGYQMGASAGDFLRFNQKLPVMDYWNLSSDDKEIREGSKIAEKILDQVTRLEGEAAQLQKRYLEAPSQVKRFAGLERELGSEIGDQEIRAKAKYWRDHRQNFDPLTQLKAKLSHFWLMVVDDGNWQGSNAFKRGGNAAFLLKRTEYFLEALDKLSGPGTGEALVQLAAEVREFLNGGLQVREEGFWGDVKDFMTSDTVANMMAPLPQAHREAYDQLKQFVDEIYYAHDMGEPIVIVPGPVSSSPGSLIGKDSVSEIQNQFLLALHQAKRTLWYSYKQHRALSRGISRVASWFETGDIEEIKAGQAALDALIQKVGKAKNAEQLTEVYQELQGQLKEEGKIHQALAAAEMEGWEQVAGVAQTIGILLLSRGLLRLGSKLTKLPTPGLAANPLHLRASKAFGVGAYLTTAENAVAVASGEVRLEGEHLEAWFKDGLATGTAMMFSGTLASYLGRQAASSGILSRIAQRYPMRTQTLQALGHVSADMALETGEEWIDGYLRAKLDDWNAVIGKDQAREIALVSTLGGGWAKMGVIGELLKTPKREIKGEGSKEKAPPQPSGQRSIRSSTLSLLLAVGGISFGVPGEAEGKTSADGKPDSGADPSKPKGDFHNTLKERADGLPTEAVQEVTEILQREWKAWKGKKKLDEATLDKLEQLIPYYARYALAFLGRETPTYLNYIPEVFEVVQGEFLKDHRDQEGLQEITDHDRIHFNRFLSTQEGRRDAGVGHRGQVAAPFNLPGIGFEKSRSLLQEVYGLWQLHLQKELTQLDLTPVEKAQIEQRAGNLFHYYTSYLYGRFGEALDPFDPEGMYQPDLLQQVLKDASKHPYSKATVKIFEDFLEADLGIKLEGRRDSSKPPSVHPADLSMQALEATPLDFVPPQIGETWSHYLYRFDKQPKGFLPKDWGLAGSTVFQWGSKKDSAGRIKPPGDILHLLGVLHYLNAEGEHEIDPFDAARLTLPEQLSHMRPDEDGRIVIYFPELMGDFDYAHFGLANLIQAYLRSVPESDDMDLAHQWGVSPATVKAYREGTTRKMRISNVEPLVDSLVKPNPNNPEQYEADRSRMRQLLYFLRYRSYFDATMTVEDLDGNPLNRRPAQASQYKVVLVPHAQSLRPLDLTRRIRFEREPFASAMNGTVDLALKLLETRREEFEMMGHAGLDLTKGKLSLSGFLKKVQNFRDKHGQYFQLLSQHEREPGVVKPGELAEIQGFYRELFRFFEEVHLHSRPQGELKLKNTKITYEIVPQTVEQPYGIRIRPDPEDPSGLRAFVVVADLLEHVQDKTPAQKSKLVRMRVMKAFLKRRDLFHDDPAFEGENRRIFARALSANGIAVTQEELEEFFHLEEITGPGQTEFDYTTEAILHRLKRGSLHRNAKERRARQWEADLRAFLARKGLRGKLTTLLPEAFGAYLIRVPEPFQSFQAEAFAEVLQPIRVQEGADFAKQLEEYLIEFMRGVGLPVENGNHGVSTEFTVEGLAEVSLASYLNRFKAINPLRATGQVVIDRTLMERVVDDRLAEENFQRLSPHRELVLQELEGLIQKYNQRQPLLKVMELSDPRISDRQAWRFPLYERVYQQSLEAVLAEDPTLNEKVSSHLIYQALSQLEFPLKQGEAITEKDLDDAVLQAASELNELGVTIDPGHLSANQAFLARLVQTQQRHLQGLDRLSRTLPDFVARNKFHSGLEDSDEVGQLTREIFQTFFQEAFLKMQPRSLETVVQDVVGNRFDPYRTIREDVIRGMSIIFFKSLEHLRDEYHQIGDALEMSAEETQSNGNVEQFWEVFIEYVSSGDSRIKSQGDVLRRIAEFEDFLWLFPFAPLDKISDQLQEVLARIEKGPKSGPEGGGETGAPPEGGPEGTGPVEGDGATPGPDARSNITQAFEEIMAQALPPEVLEKFPELTAESQPQLLKVWARLDGENIDFNNPEGRTILQVLGFLETFKGRFIDEINAQVEALYLEIQTAPEGESLESISNHLMEGYLEIRRDILNRIPLLDLLRHFPEFSRIGKVPLPDEISREVLQIIFDRDLPKPLEENFWNIFGARGIGWDPVIFAHRALGWDSEDQEADQGIANFYLSHRNDILDAPSLGGVPEGEKRINPPKPPEMLKNRVQQLLPEIDLISEEDFFGWFQERAKETKLFKYSELKDFGKKRIFLYESNYPLLRIFHFLQTIISEESALFKEIEELYHWQELFISSGGISFMYDSMARKLSHLAMQWLEAHRDEIRRALIQEHGLADVVGAYHEIRDQEIEPIRVPSKNGEIVLERSKDFEPAAKAINLMLGRDLPKGFRKGLEQILWEIDAFELKADDPTQKEKFKAFSERVLTFYLRHREKVLASPPRSAQTPTPRNIPWELNAFTDGAKKREESQKNILRKFSRGERVFVLGRRGPDGQFHQNFMNLQQTHDMRLAFTRGESYTLPESPHVTLTKGDDFKLLEINHPMKFLTPILILGPLQAIIHEFSQQYEKHINEKIVKLDSQAGNLLWLGVDEPYLIPQFEERLLKAHHSGRQKLIEKYSFTNIVEKLPEVQDVPQHVMEELDDRVESPGLTIRERFDITEYELRLLALIHNSGFLDQFRKSYKTAARQQAKKMGGKGASEIEEAQKEIWARMYLHLRPEILAKLKPWPDPPSEETTELVQEVSNYPEIADSSFDESKIPAPDWAKEKVGTPELLLLKKISWVITKFPSTARRKLLIQWRETFRDFFQAEGTLENLAQWYKKNRAAILQEYPGGIKILQDTIAAYPEIEEITEEQVFQSYLLFKPNGSQKQYRKSNQKYPWKRITTKVGIFLDNVPLPKHLMDQINKIQNQMDQINKIQNQEGSKQQSASALLRFYYENRDEILAHNNPDPAIEKTPEEPVPALSLNPILESLKERFKKIPEVQKVLDLSEIKVIPLKVFEAIRREILQVVSEKNWEEHNDFITLLSIWIATRPHLAKSFHSEEFLNFTPDKKVREAAKWYLKNRETINGEIDPFHPSVGNSPKIRKVRNLPEIQQMTQEILKFRKARIWIHEKEPLFFPYFWAGGVFGEVFTILVQSPQNSKLFKEFVDASRKIMGSRILFDHSPLSQFAAEFYLEHRDEILAHQPDALDAESKDKLLEDLAGYSELRAYSPKVVQWFTEKLNHKGFSLKGPLAEWFVKMNLLALSVPGLESFMEKLGEIAESARNDEELLEALTLYRDNREDILAKVANLREETSPEIEKVLSFPEIQTVSDETIQRLKKYFETNFPSLAWLLELGGVHAKVAGLLVSWHKPPKIIEKLQRQFMQEAKDQGLLRKDRIQQYAAEFYLEHRNEILPHLDQISAGSSRATPNGEAKLSPDEALVQEVSNYPELQEFSDNALVEQMKNIAKKRGRKIIGAPWDTPTLRKIAKICDEPYVPAKLREEFTEVIKNYVDPQKSDLPLLNWYKKNRNKILAAKVNYERQHSLALPVGLSAGLEQIFSGGLSEKFNNALGLWNSFGHWEVALPPDTLPALSGLGSGPPAYWLLGMAAAGVLAMAVSRKGTPGPEEKSQGAERLVRLDGSSYLFLRYLFRKSNEAIPRFITPENLGGILKRLANFERVSEGLEPLPGEAELMKLLGEHFPKQLNAERVLAEARRQKFENLLDSDPRLSPVPLEFSQNTLKDVPFPSGPTAISINELWNDKPIPLTEEEIHYLSWDFGFHSSEISQLNLEESLEVLELLAMGPPDFQQSIHQLDPVGTQLLRRIFLHHREALLLQNNAVARYVENYLRWYFKEDFGGGPPPGPKYGFVTLEGQGHFRMPGHREVVVLGSNPKGEFSVPGDNTYVSFHHASIFLEEDGSYYLQDLGAPDGTFVNGRRLPREGLQKIQVGDKFTLGNRDFIFQLEKFHREEGSP